MNNKINKINWSIPFCIYVLINCFMLFFHEPWRDEMQAFSHAKTSNSITDLFYSTRYEGHPSLWFLMLFLYTRISTSIFILQFLHLIIMFSGVYVLLRYSTIKMLQKILIVFGYYFIFEYSLLFRNYSIGITLLFITCVFIEKRKILFSAILIFIVLQTNVYSFFLGISLWLICFIPFYKLSARNAIIGTLIIFIGIFFFVLNVLPPNDSGYAVGYQIKLWPILSTFINIWKSFILIPKFDIHFWNSNILEYLPEKNNILIMRIASVFLFLFILFILRKSNRAIIYFIVCILLLTAFSGIKFDGYLRHNGHIFISFIIALWIKEIFPNKVLLFKDISFLKRCNEQFYIKRESNYFLNILLLIHVFCGFVAYYYEYHYSFSKAKEVATYLKVNKMTDYQIIGHSDFSVSTIASMLNRKVYYPTSKDSSTFIVWNNKRNENVSEEQLLQILSQKRKENNQVLLITSFKIQNITLLNLNNVKLIKTFKPAIVESEEFYLYR
ncbi:MAG: hypothetical protein ACOYO1_14630 [Bacteroidales bacterium]